MRGSLALVFLILVADSFAHVVLLKCGDPISIRSRENWKYATFPKAGEVGMISGEVGVNQVVKIECENKAVGDLLETGDSIALALFRGGGYLRDSGKAGLALVVGPKTLFYVEDATNQDARATVWSTQSKLSLRTTLDSNAFVTVSSLDSKIRPVAPDASSPAAQFVFSFVVTDFRQRCPEDRQGNVCSGQGTCESNFCACNREYTGEFCEHKREVSVCKAVGDPHWVSFDGAYYNMYETGEFLLYSNPNSPSHEAVTIITSPWNAASVITAVTVRRDSDYITVWGHGKNTVSINCGAQDSTGLVVNAGPAGTTLPASGLNIRLENGWFVITSPSYLEVRFKGFSLYVTIEEPRLGGARGLCGNNDGDASNDMMPRFRYNEPDLGVVEKLRIEDGNDYLYNGIRAGTKNGRQSRAFSQCLGDDTFFNFIAEDSPVITEDVVPAAPSVATTLTSSSTHVRSKVKVATLFGTNPGIEEALDSEKCKTIKDAPAGALSCCAKVLVAAKLLTKDGSSAPSTTDGLKALVTDEALAKANAGATSVPKASSIIFDVITCVQDYCVSGNCALGDQHADDVASDAETRTRAKNEAVRIAKVNKEQKASQA